MESEAIYPRRAMTNRSSDSASTASSVASSKPHVVQNYRSRIAILQLRARKRENENALLREQLDSQKAEKHALQVRILELEETRIHDDVMRARVQELKQRLDLLSSTDQRMKGQYQDFKSSTKERELRFVDAISHLKQINKLLKGQQEKMQRKQASERRKVKKYRMLIVQLQEVVSCLNRPSTRTYQAESSSSLAVNASKMLVVEQARTQAQHSDKVPNEDSHKDLGKRLHNRAVSVQESSPLCLSVSDTSLLSVPSDPSFTHGKGTGKSLKYEPGGVQIEEDMRALDKGISDLKQLLAGLDC